MRIGVYDPYLDTLSGGEKYMLNIARCLRGAHDVTLFWDKDTEKIRERVLSKFGYELDHISFSPNIFSPNFSFLKRFKESRKYDAIILLSDGSIPFLSCDLYLHFQSPMGWVTTLSIKERIKIRRVKRVFCNSEFTKRYIDKTFRVKSDVLYPPIDNPIPGEIGKENIILNVGRFGIQRAGSSFKKQDVMVRAFQEMEKELRGWKFVLIVSTMSADEKSQLNELRYSIGKSAIEIIENTDSTTLQKYYRKAKVYWHAAGYGENIDQHPDRAEHFGMATVESMGYGAVPIVINKGGQKEIVTQAVDGFLWDTLDELKEHTRSVVSDSHLLESLSNEAKKKAMLFRTELFCKRLTGIIS